jgi:23S rRNA (uracil1939-C5)-methyltransferase
MSFDKNDLSLPLQEPLKPGALVEGVIEKLGFGGVGLLRHHGFVIFICFCLPQEKVIVEIEKVYKNYATAKLIKIVLPSPNRVQPKCKVFGICGGCQLQHLSYEEQLKHKEEVVNDSIKKIAKIDSPHISIIPSPKIWAYRRHITLKRQGEKAGFIGVDNKTFIEIDECPIFDNNKFELLPGQTKLFKSNEHVHQIMDLTIFSSPNAFIQNHKEQSEAIYKDVVNKILNINPRKVLDLYCGIGITSILIAKNSIDCLGIELNKEAIELAKKSANYNKVDKVKFLAAPVEKVIHSQEKFDVILVNPPRTGLDKKAIEGIKKINPEHIFYISCMPQTLARDVQLLGYDIIQGSCYDMFPQTAHVETLLHLQRKSQ